MLAKIKLIIAATVGAAMIMMGITIYFLNDKVDTLNEEKGILKADLVKVRGINEGLNKKIDGIRIQAKKDSKNLGKLGAEVVAAIVQRDEAHAKYDNYKDRMESLIIGRPTLMAKKATRATEKIMNEIRKATDYEEIFNYNDSVDSN